MPISNIPTTLPISNASTTIPISHIQTTLLYLIHQLQTDETKYTLECIPPPGRTKENIDLSFSKLGDSNLVILFKNETNLIDVGDNKKIRLIATIIVCCLLVLIVVLAILGVWKKQKNKKNKKNKDSSDSSIHRIN